MHRNCPEFSSQSHSAEEDRCGWLHGFHSFYDKSNVLIGNWCEDRSENQSEQNDIWPVYDGTNPLSSITEYKEKYQDIRNPSNENVDEDWDTKFKEEEERLALLGRQEEYLENMASSYDLHYRYCIQDIPRGEILDSRPDSCLHHKPDTDYSISYGNPTQYGLRAYKNFLWQQEKNEEKYVRTTYQMSYGCPVSAKPWNRDVFGKSSEPLHLNAETNKRTYQENATATNHRTLASVPQNEPGRRRPYLRCGQI